MKRSLGVIALVALATSAAAAAGPRTRLTVTVWPQGLGADTPSRTWTLRCEPPGGTHPRPARACRALLRNRTALRPVPRDAVCTEIWGGPQVARVRGVLRGRRISSWFNRRNGCEIHRWDRLAPVFVLDV